MFRKWAKVLLYNYKIQHSQYVIFSYV